MKMAVAALGLVVVLSAAEHKDQWQRTFPVGDGARLEVRNINGSIRVLADGGNAIRATVSEEYAAGTAEELAELRKHTRVITTQEGNVVRLAVEHANKDGHSHGKGWNFNHHFELHVPKAVELSLHNVNGRELSVTGVTGKWELKSVNGGITLADASGYGSLETVNGPVKARFLSNPSKATSFKTLNGTIDVSFQPNLAADIFISTMHGGAWTDFDYQQGGGNAGKKRLRIGGGGIEHSFNTLNGSIKIRKNG